MRSLDNQGFLRSPTALSARSAFPYAGSMERRKVGEVFHYFTKIGVAAIRLTDGDLAVGDTIVIQGPSTNVTSRVETMQIEHVVVTSASCGQEVGIHVADRVREKDLVYKVTA